MRCVSICYGKAFKFLAITRLLRQYDFDWYLDKNVLGIWHDAKDETIFMFSNGCLVLWNVSALRQQWFLDKFARLAVVAAETMVRDDFIYRKDRDNNIFSHDRFPVDIITLEDTDNYEIKRAISFGLAQSIKLNRYEIAIHEVQQESHALPSELAAKGKISLSGSAIMKKVGEIYIAKNTVNLSRDQLGIPEFVWRNPNLEQHYTLVEKFMDVQERTMWLNEKLDRLSDLLEILTSHLECRRSHFLEMIIIILIFTEIVLSFLH